MQKIKSRDRGNAANYIKELFKRWPRLYYFIFDFFSPVYFGGLSSSAFLRKYPNEWGVSLNVGSGARRLASNVVNVDIAAYSEVDVVSDITSLPYTSGSVSRIVCDQVLEHVSDPISVVAELERVLAPGGYLYVSTPFMYPFHASPSDYQRWTHEGLKQLFSSFELVELGVRCGPFSTLVVQLCYLFGSLFSFGNERLYWIIVYGMAIPLFPIKCLDVVGNRLPFAVHMAAVSYMVMRKECVLVEHK